MSRGCDASTLRKLPSGVSFSISVRDREEIFGIVGDEEDCHPFDRKWRGVDGRARTPRRARR